MQRDRYGPLAPSVCSVATVLPENLSHITCHYIFPTIKTLKDYIILNMTTITVFQPQRTYNFHIFTIMYSPPGGFIWSQPNDQLLVGLLAQFVERCTSSAKVMSSNPVRA